MAEGFENHGGKGKRISSEYLAEITSQLRRVSMELGTLYWREPLGKLVVSKLAEWTFEKFGLG